MISRGTSVHQTSYKLLCHALCGVLRDAVQSARGGGVGVGSVACRAAATLYGLLLDHPVDRRGWCRSCRRPGEVLGLRRRRCRVQIKAHFYLHHPDDAFLLSHLASEVGLPAAEIPETVAAAPEPGSPTAPGSGLDDTDILPKITDESGMPPPESLGRHGAGGEHGHRETQLLPDPASVARGRSRRLTGTELLDWIGLRRVRQGGVAIFGTHYLDHGRTVPCFLPETFRRLTETELTELLDQDHPGGPRRVVITPDGQCRYHELSAKRSPTPEPNQSPGRKHGRRAGW